MDIASLLTSTETTRLAAAINVSPESFFAGSVAVGGDAIAEAAQRAQAEGASLLDIGAMSTAPYKETRITVDEEIERMVAAVKAARSASHLPISADTQRAQVAEAALEAGAVIVNDISGLRNDPALGALVARRGAGIILMASEHTDLDEQGQDPVGVVVRLLIEAVERALSCGIPRKHLVLDPGVGFFRHRSVPWHGWDMEVLRGLDRIRALGIPVMVGASRKSFLGHLLGRKDPNDRLAGSLAVALHCADRGVEWLRVHDVGPTRDALEIRRQLHSGGLG